MAELPGELIAHPSPNRPGWWVYRQLPNGVLLQVELTKEEWFQLSEQYRRKRQDSILDLENHPLNLAARAVLEQAKKFPLPSEISLITLGRYTFDEDVPDWDDDLMALNDWARGPGTMQNAIQVLEEAEVTPENLRSRNLVDAAQFVLYHLLK
jgi:hypothetical protein